MYTVLFLNSIVSIYVVLRQDEIIGSMHLVRFADTSALKK